MKWGNTLEQLVERNFTFVTSTMVANMSGEPSISLPLCWREDGLPCSPSRKGSIASRTSGATGVVAAWSR